MKTWRLNLFGMHAPSQRGRLWHPCTSLSVANCEILFGKLWNTVNTAWHVVEYYEYCVSVKPLQVDN